MAYKWNGAPELAEVAPVLTIVAPVEPPKAKPGPKPKPRVFDPDRCGTVPGYKQHRKHHQDACAPCKAAMATYGREYAARVKLNGVRRGFNPDKCGTRAGYRRHEHSDVPTCGPCRAANSERSNAYRAARKAAA